MVLFRERSTVRFEIPVRELRRRAERIRQCSCGLRDTNREIQTALLYEEVQSGREVCEEVLGKRRQRRQGTAGGEEEQE